jgi:hypothetical protein
MKADYQSAARCHPAPHGPIANWSQAVSLHHNGALSSRLLVEARQ